MNSPASAPSTPLAETLDPIGPCEAQATEIIAGACDCIRQMREAVGWSQDKTGSMVGMAGWSVGRVETGFTTPSSASLVRLLVLFGRTMAAVADSLRLTAADVARLTQLEPQVVELIYRGAVLDRRALLAMVQVMGQQLKIGRMQQEAARRAG